MIQLTDKHWAVEVPDDASKVRIMKFSKPETFSYDYSITRNGKSTSGLIGMIDLPPGTWQYLFTTREATEEQAKQVVEKSFDGYVDYDKEGFHSDIPFAYVRQSLESLLRSKGLDDKKNYAIIQKQNDNGTE